MLKRCLVCESRAILPREAAMCIVVLLGLAEDWVRANHIHHYGPTQPPLTPWYGMLLSGLASMAPSYRCALQVAPDVSRYQFGSFNCLCLALWRHLQHRKGSNLRE
jgi:uncharacterized membrane protein